MAIGGSQPAPFTPKRITSLRVWEIFLHFFFPCSLPLSPDTCSLCLSDVHSAALGEFAGWIAQVKDDKTENRSASLEREQQWRRPVDGRRETRFTRLGVQVMVMMCVTLTSRGI